MKRFLTLVIVVVTSVAATTAQKSIVIDNLRYYLDTSTRTAEVTGVWSGEATSVIIPKMIVAEYQTYLVTSIGRGAFKDDSGLTSIEIPNSVTNIGGEAFYGCSSLTSITIPNSVTSIGYSAFDGCSSLTAVHITSVAAWCKISFGADTYGSSYVANPLCYAHNLYLNGELVTDLEIPNSIKSIGGGAFYGCSSLTSVTIPNSVTSIGNSAFSGCSSLTSVTIPNSVTSIGSSAFGGCSSLTSVTIPNSVTSIGSSAFGGCSSLTSVTIPNSVTSIGSSAFSGCSGLTSVTIGNSVTSIGNYAFSGCSGLTSVTIPNSVTSIGEYAFARCSSLTSVTIPNSVTSIGNETFIGCNINKVDFIGTIKEWCNKSWSPKSCMQNYYDYATISYSLYINGVIVTDLVIPNSVTSIGDYAFYGCCSLTSVTIPNNVTSIGEYAFRGCNNLTSVTINSNEIVSKNYTSNSNLISIFGSQVIEYIIAGGVTSIGDYAFYAWNGISELTYVTISNSVTSIGEGAFYENRHIKNLIVQSKTPPQIKKYSLPLYAMTNFEYTTIYIPCNTRDAYVAAKYWFVREDLSFGSYINDIRELEYTLTFIIDEEEYSKINLCDGEEIVLPTKKGYTFIPNEEIPELMPEHDLTITGAFAVNSYDVVCMIDNEEYQRISVPYGTKLTAIAEPAAREGYTFSGWSKLPATMPANDVTITGSFTANNYALIYLLDGKEYYRTNIVYGTPLTAIAEPVAREGYTFSGWSKLPATMPANDVTITGSFIINQYTITVIVNDTKSGYVTGEGRYDYGKTVTLTATPADGYRFVRWSDNNTDNPRTIVITEEMTLTAYFERIPDALEETDTDCSPRATKVFENGQIYILLPDGRHYNLQGMEVK